MRGEAARSRRSPTLDVLRGFVLLTIFVNHIPGNLLENFTYRNLGFSDAAEAFVFIAGVSVAIAYFPRVVSSGAGEVAKKLVWRAVQLYRVHLTLTFVALGVFALAYVVSEAMEFLEADGRAAIYSASWRGLLSVLLLDHQLGYFNILPLYVVLMLMAPILLLLARVHPAIALAFSFAIYLGASHGPLHMPNWTSEPGWFFNPFAWQFMMTLGIVAGILWRERPVPYVAPLFWACVAFLALGAFIGTNGLGLWPGLLDQTYEHLDLDKTNLAFVRLLHFLALAYVVAETDWSALARTPIGEELARLGRHALPVFAVGSLLAVTGQVAMAVGSVKYAASPHSVGLLFTLAGVASLIALARFLSNGSFRRV